MPHFFILTSFRGNFEQWSWDVSPTYKPHDAIYKRRIFALIFLKLRIWVHTNGSLKPARPFPAIHHRWRMYPGKFLAALHQGRPEQVPVIVNYRLRRKHRAGAFGGFCSHLIPAAVAGPAFLHSSLAGCESSRWLTKKSNRILSSFFTTDNLNPKNLNHWINGVRILVIMIWKTNCIPEPLPWKSFTYSKERGPGSRLPVVSHFLIGNRAPERRFFLASFHLFCWIPIPDFILS